MSLIPWLRRLAPPLFGLCLALPGIAATQSFQGQFVHDDDLAVFSVTLPASGTLSAISFSHSGGVNAAGTPVPDGGFAPVLSILDADGLVVGVNAGSSNLCQGAGTFCWDAQLTTNLQAGQYLLVLSQDGNAPAPQGPVTAATVASAFPMTGQPAYTSPFAGTDDPAVRFIRLDGTPRTGLWALDITATNPVTQVPEPGTWLLLGLGLAVLSAAARRGGSAAALPCASSKESA